MTDGIAKFLNLPPLDEVLKDRGVDIDDDETVQQSVDKFRELASQNSMMEGADHSESMDTLHDEIVQHARDLMAYGYNVDIPRQRGIFEIASLMYGHAISSKNSKRDAQLKSIKLMLDRRKVDLDERRTNHVIGQHQIGATVDEAGTIVVEDRNELLKRLREQIKQSD